MLRTVGDAGGLRGIELKLGKNFESRAQNENGPAILQGKVELFARWIVRDGVGVAVEAEMRNWLTIGRKIEDRNGLGLWIGDAEKVFAGEQVERVGSSFDGNSALDLPVGSGDHDNVARSGVGDIDQVSGLIDDNTARGGHVENVSDDAALLRVEEID